MGFINTPYTAKTLAAPMKAARAEAARTRRRGFSRTMTADKVAKILEGKYNIVEMFYEIHADEIQELLTDAYGVAVVEMLSGKQRFSKDKIKRGMKTKTEKINRMFRSFLDQEEMNGQIEGVPTKAADTGKGRKYHRTGRSFVNTGVYRASFRSWVA